MDENKQHTSNIVGLIIAMQSKIKKSISMIINDLITLGGNVNYVEEAKLDKDNIVTLNGSIQNTALTVYLNFPTGFNEKNCIILTGMYSLPNDFLHDEYWNYASSNAIVPQMGGTYNGVPVVSFAIAGVDRNPSGHSAIVISTTLLQQSVIGHIDYKVTLMKIS